MPEALGRQRTESDVIDIMGSLCLEGVFQGLSEDNDPHKALLPSSIRMTDNLVKRGEELDELSVMVTRNLEIVPESPFDMNTGTKKSLGILKARGNRHSSKYIQCTCLFKKTFMLHFDVSSQIAITS